MDVQFLVKHQVKNDKLRDTPDNVQHTSAISTLSLVSCGFHSFVRAAFERSVFSHNDHASIDHNPSPDPFQWSLWRSRYWIRLLLLSPLRHKNSDERVYTFGNKAISSKIKCISSKGYARPFTVVIKIGKATYPCAIDRPTKTFLISHSTCARY